MDLKDEHLFTLTMTDLEVKRFRQIFEAAQTENLSALKLLKRDIIEFMKTFGWLD